MDTLFDPSGDEAQDARMRRVASFFAPVAADAGAVAADASVLDLADAVYRAFGDLDADGGLTRAQIAAACADVRCDRGFESRFDLFVSLGMLMPVRDKLHQQRYVFNPTSAAALMVFERLGTDGGVQEILTLLDRTRAGLRSGVATAEQVAASLARARRGFAVYADHLLRLVRSCPLEELLEERRFHRANESLLTDARDLVHLVVEKHPALAVEGDRLVGEAVRYSGAVAAFIDRLLDEATSHRDFSMLDAEQYRSAALIRSRDELAMPFERTVFDAPRLWLDADQLVAAIDEVKPRARRQRPPRPVDPPPGEDPVEAARRRANATRERRRTAVELHLDGGGQADLTSRIRAAGWPAAARMVADVLAAHADPRLPYEAVLSDALLVDAHGPVSHVTPVHVLRALDVPDALAPDGSEVRERDVDAVEAADA